MLLVFGINHQRTPLPIRERLNFSSAQLPDALKSLIVQPGVTEAVILSTCNRTEIYSNLTSPDIIADWLSKEKNLHDIDLAEYHYTHQGIDAISHLMRVACGLDSAILGEPQILGQLKNAYFSSEENKTTGDFFKQLFPMIFSSGKYIRTNTTIGLHSVSLAHNVMQLAKNIFTDYQDKNILLIGAGETIELIAQYFFDHSMHHITLANRTLKKSEKIAAAVHAKTIEIHHVRDILKSQDIVITATASQLPILGKGMIESAIAARKNPLLLIDLAVPRDIEPEAAGLDGVHLYNIDDLQTVITENKQHRQTAALEAETLIQLQIEEFQKKMRVFEMRHVITRYRESLEKIRDEEFEKARQQLQRGIDPQIVLEIFSTQLMNKIMHHPTMKIREAASEEKCTMLQHVKAFFEMEE